MQCENTTTLGYFIALHVGRIGKGVGGMAVCADQKVR